MSSKMYRVLLTVFILMAVVALTSLYQIVGEEILGIADVSEMNDDTFLSAVLLAVGLLGITVMGAVRKKKAKA